MPDIEVMNWFGDVVSHPKVVVAVNSADDLVRVVKDPAQYPSPVRCVGSNHSTSSCGVADGGTLLKMSGMSQILSVGAGRLTAQAGAIYIDIAHQLEQQGLQFHINTEIGNLTLGSAACGGTKDGSFPGEYGQVGSYVTGVKMVLASGDLLEVTESQPDLLQQVRSSYGTMGLVYEVTIRVRPLQPMAVHHETFTLQDFIQKVPDILNRNESVMLYLFPFDNLITVEFRHDNPGASGSPDRHIWPLRNYLWGTAGPRFCRDMEANISDPKVRYAILDDFNAIWRFKLENLIRSDYTIASDQIIRYPIPADDSRYTFSFWAFPEQTYATALSQYFDFCRAYYQQKGYRSNMLSVGYRVAKDQNALLSYSYDGNVITIDPVSTANPGWYDFLDAYNNFCSNLGAFPLLNQTDRLTSAQARKAFSNRLQSLEAARKAYDPENRLLNEYFRGLLSN